jgi:hypothetical protein
MVGFRFSLIPANICSARVRCEGLARNSVTHLAERRGESKQGAVQNAGRDQGRVMRLNPYQGFAPRLAAARVKLRS